MIIIKNKTVFLSELLTTFKRNNLIIYVGDRNNIALYLGWVTGEPKNLER